ncbi:prepilin-type N-terminal cleavage/methylation domain-containing protein [Curvibacter sp. HBC61]|uniref:Prepilin-type N-terminal cleavage/methylation domain-containing protein n=1 Tax=Curvibacter cyanobacteriorum TaxID=3026422 RepID=A0ABT5MYF9_9BURK|nr:prepilin-type N-terminal cleavage/methylation domain-containing protein [Curvibacter sp. HBC61]MDD0839069.1 prepilin-type N-terminal cleavage/methylation domain-containing protein [Curvibacter sp. HBC61]
MTKPPLRQRPARAHGRGFTLVELLIALSVMAIMALLSWQGLDGMVRTQRQTDQYSQDVLALQAGLGQWQADLDALIELPQVSALDWDGRVLRLTRRGPASAPESTLVVGWTLRNAGSQGQWLRWQSPPLSRRSEWERAWQQAALWGQNPDEAARQREVVIAPATEWQIFYYRQDAWTNPLSSDASSSGTSPGAGAPPPPAGSAGQNGAARPGSNTAGELPQGVRLLLTLAPGQALSGRLQRDWARPNLGGGKS